jgi:DNA-directed RNA polymerase sigma subunit (sigma70/sigma32)
MELTSQQYHHELSHIRELSNDEERRQADLARAGDRQARACLAESLLHAVARIGGSFARRFCLDPQDVLSVGNWILMEYLDRAIACCELPHRYLGYVLPRKLIEHYTTTATVIRVPRRCQAHQVVSLDKMLAETQGLPLAGVVAAPAGRAGDGDERHHEGLLQALDGLPEHLRTTLIRRYGLDTHAPSAQCVVARELGTVRITIRRRERTALALLRSRLSEQMQGGAA